MKTITKLFSVALLFGASALSAVCTAQPAAANGQVAAYDNPYAQPMNDPQNPNNNNNDEQMLRGPNGQPIIKSGYNNAASDQEAHKGFFSNFMNNSDRPALQNRELLSRVRQTLMNSPDINARAIQVTTDNNGTVTLIGIVRNEADKANAENAIKSINGVKNVDNKLTTQPTATPTTNSNW